MRKLLTSWSMACIYCILKFVTSSFPLLGFLSFVCRCPQRLSRTFHVSMLYPSCLVPAEWWEERMLLCAASATLRVEWLGSDSVELGVTMGKTSIIPTCALSSLLILSSFSVIFLFNNPLLEFFFFPKSKVLEVRVRSTFGSKRTTRKNWN